MEPVIVQLAARAEQAADFLWLPVAIWTIVSLAGWLVLRSMPQIHPQLQYQGRLAIIFSLPAGLVFLGILKGINALMFAESAANNLVLVSFASPLEIGITPAETAQGLATAEWVYFGCILLFATGMLLFVVKFIVQWIQLIRLKKSLDLQPVEFLANLDSDNKTLVSQCSKKIRISFLNEEIVPVTFGYRNPVILLPHTLSLDTDKLNLAVRHELTHITQKDFLTHALVLVTQLLFWVHPLIHLYKKELVDFREMRCDSLVLSGETVSRKKYASLLLELLPMPNINKELSVNMAQESSNLKKRIQMIVQQNLNRPIPKRTGLAIFATILICTAVAMACTDMQTHDVFDNEELDLITNIDRNGERGYHEIIIYMSEEQQAERHENKLSQLRMLQPEHITSIEVWKGDEAISRYGDRGAEGVIVVKTKLDPDSYNTTLQAMGMNPVNPQELVPSSSESEPEDFFIVVEEMPELIDGLASIQRQIRYPEMARRAGIEGRVYVQFVVNEQGDVERPRVIRGIGGGADEEALRVVSQAQFRPGMQRGQPVRVQYSLPIFFRLQGNEPQTSQRLEDPEEGDLLVVGYGSSGSSPRAEIGQPMLTQKQMEIELRQEGGRISGTVIDSESGNPLAGANIIIPGTNTGTSTDASGSFSLDNTNDVSAIEISYIGYQRTQVAI